MNRTSSFIAAALAAALPLAAQATVFYWTGAAGDGSFSTLGNWVTGSATSTTVPTTLPQNNNYKDQVVFTTAANPATTTVNFPTYTVNQITFTGEGWVTTGTYIKAKKILVSAGSGTVETSVGLNSGNGLGFEVKTGCELSVANSLIESTQFPQLVGGGTLHFKNKITYNYYAAGGAFLVKDDSLLVTDQPYTAFSNTNSSYPWTIRLSTVGARFQCKNTPEQLEARFNTAVKGSWNFSNAYDNVNYVLAARALTETTSEVYLKLANAEEGDPFVLGVPSSSGNVADGITMSVDVTDFNTSNPVQLRLYFGTDADSLALVHSWDLTEGGTYAYTQTDGVDYGSKYYFQFACEGTENGEAFVRESVVYSFTTPGDFAWVGEDGEWADGANWDMGSAPRTLCDVYFRKVSPTVTGADGLGAKTFNVLSNSVVRLSGGSFTIASALELGLGTTNKLYLDAVTMTAPSVLLAQGNDRAGHELYVNEGSSLAVSGAVRIGDNRSKLVVDGGSLTAESLYNAERFANTRDAEGAASRVSVVNGGSLTVTGTLYGNSHVDGATVEVLDGSTCTVGTLDLGYGADSGYNGRLIVSNAMFKAGTVNFQSNDCYQQSIIRVYETEDGTAKFTVTGTMTVGLNGSATRAAGNNLFSLTGGTASIGTLQLGGTVNSTNNTCSIAGGTLTAGKFTVLNKSHLKVAVPEDGLDGAPIAVTGATTFSEDSDVTIDCSAYAGAGRLAILTAESLDGLAADQVTVLPNEDRHFAATDYTVEITDTALTVRCPSRGTLLVLQ